MKKGNLERKIRENEKIFLVTEGIAWSKREYVSIKET